jgi:AcrR family transcriptional regulator
MRKKRKYTLKRRAERQERTRERIVAAAMALHEEIGPAETTISALAERAGVQRLTVYRHFEDEHAILEACSNRWFGLHPPPEPAAIQGDEPTDLTRAMLAALYEYYAENERMWSSLYRDKGRSAALEGPMSKFESYLSTLHKTLLAAWRPARSRALRATLAHALRFSTWQSLADQGLAQNAITALVSDWIGTAANRR